MSEPTPPGGCLPACTFAAVVAWILLAQGGACLAEKLEVGTGSFTFVDADGNADRPITVWYHRPESFRETDAIVIVMHGSRRNGQGYRDTWIEHAEGSPFLLLVPEFSREHYPGSRRYQQGYLRDSDGAPRDRSQWTFTAVERLFDRVVAENGLQQEEYILYGHSAGGQFVHRMVLLMPEARFKLAIAANAGWYVAPLLDVEYPDGLADAGVNECGLRQAFAKRVVVLVGNNDNDPNHHQLAQSPHAMTQGPHRLSRALWYFAAAAEQARLLEAQFDWQLQTVPGAGHSNAKMSAAAARLIP